MKAAIFAFRPQVEAHSHLGERSWGRVVIHGAADEELAINWHDFIAMQRAEHKRGTWAKHMRCRTSSMSTFLKIVLSSIFKDSKLSPIMLRSRMRSLNQR